MTNVAVNEEPEVSLQQEVEMQKKAKDLESLMLFIVRRWPPMTKTIRDKSIVQTTAQTNMYSVSKKLWDSPELAAIVNNESILDGFIKRYSSPMPLRAGHHLLSKELLRKVEDRLTLHLAERVPLIDAFINVFDDTVKQSMSLLGDQGKITDYPTKEQVRGYFFFGWGYLDFKVSGKLETLPPEIISRKKEQLEQEEIEAKEVQKLQLRGEMLEHISHLVDRLESVEKDGELKRKTFRDTLLDKYNEFNENYDARNLSGDDQLTTLVIKGVQLLKGVTPEKLRESDGLRIETHQKFSVLKQSLKELIG